MFVCTCRATTLTYATILHVLVPTHIHALYRPLYGTPMYLYTGGDSDILLRGTYISLTLQSTSGNSQKVVYRSTSYVSGCWTHHKSFPFLSDIDLYCDAYPCVHQIHGRVVALSYLIFMNCEFYVEIEWDEGAAVGDPLL